MCPVSSRPDNNTIWRRLFLAAVLGLGAMAPPAGAGAEEKPGEAAGPVLDSLAAADLRTLLDSHRGKVVLVNFWATWCGPCIQEIPALMELREELDPSAFALVAVSLDDPADSPWLVAEFIETRFPEWSSYLSAEIEDYLLVEELDPYWPGVMPANYVIGADGSIAKTLLGGHSREQFEQAVRAAMPEPEAATRQAG